jgi:hypothetical protein
MEETDSKTCFECDGVMSPIVINNGVTRATRIAKLCPGTTVRVEVIDDLPIAVGSFPSIGDLQP